MCDTVGDMGVGDMLSQIQSVKETLRYNIPVYIFELVYRIDCNDHFRDVKSCHIFWKAILELAQERE